MKIPMEEIFLIERGLSHAISVHFATGDRLEGIREVIRTRDELRKILRKAGYKGQF